MTWADPVNHELTPLQKQVALFLAQGHTLVEIAEHHGLAYGTIKDWSGYPAFRELVERYAEEIEKEALAYAKKKITSLQVKAVDGLEHLVEKAESESVRLGAIREALDLGPLRPTKYQPGQALPQGAVIVFPDKMILAMQKVSELTGDQEMLALLPSLPEQDRTSPSPSLQGEGE